MYRIIAARSVQFSESKSDSAFLMPAGSDVIIKRHDDISRTVKVPKRQANADPTVLNQALHKKLRKRTGTDQSSGVWTPMGQPYRTTGDVDTALPDSQFTVRPIDDKPLESNSEFNPTPRRLASMDSKGRLDLVADVIFKSKALLHAKRSKAVVEEEIMNANLESKDIEQTELELKRRYDIATLEERMKDVAVRREHIRKLHRRNAREKRRTEAIRKHELSRTKRIRYKLLGWGSPESNKGPRRLRTMSVSSPAPHYAQRRGSVVMPKVAPHARRTSLAVPKRVAHAPRRLSLALPRWRGNGPGAASPGSPLQGDASAPHGHGVRSRSVASSARSMVSDVSLDSSPASPSSSDNDVDTENLAGLSELEQTALLGRRPYHEQKQTREALRRLAKEKERERKRRQEEVYRKSKTLDRKKQIMLWHDRFQRTRKERDKDLAEELDKRRSESAAAFASPRLAAAASELLLGDFQRGRLLTHSHSEDSRGFQSVWQRARKARRAKLNATLNRIGSASSSRKGTASRNRGKHGSPQLAKNRTLTTEEDLASRLKGKNTNSEPFGFLKNVSTAKRAVSSASTTNSTASQAKRSGKQHKRAVPRRRRRSSRLYGNNSSRASSRMSSADTATHRHRASKALVTAQGSVGSTAEPQREMGTTTAYHKVILVARERHRVGQPSMY